MSRALFTLYVAGFSALPVSAQDMNTLDRHLEHQRWQRLQDHQSRMRSPNPRGRVAQSCSIETLPASDKRRLADGYKLRAKRDGKESADMWIHEEGQRYRTKLVEQGICPKPRVREKTEIDQRRKQTRSGR